MTPPQGFTVYADQGPFLEHVGPIHERDGDFGILAEERHANRRGTIMGGMLATLADFAIGRAIEAEDEDGKQRATVSLTVDFLRPAHPGDWIETRSKVDRVGGRLAFADVSLLVDEKEIVRARAVFAG